MQAPGYLGPGLQFIPLKCVDYRYQGHQDDHDDHGHRHHHGLQGHLNEKQPSVRQLRVYAGTWLARPRLAIHSTEMSYD